MNSADAAYQGARGAFSEDAALALLGAGAELLPCPTLDDVFAAVAAGRARSAVVPIENTLAGAVPGCADLIGRHGVHIVAERVQPIRHALIAPPGVAMSDVRRVLSHPVALAQCEQFFRKHPDITAVPVFDTAGAVELVTSRREPDAAAIAGPARRGRLRRRRPRGRHPGPRRQPDAIPPPRARRRAGVVAARMEDDDRVRAEERARVARARALPALLAWAQPDAD